MDKKTTGIIAYVTFIGMIVAICSAYKDDEDIKFHINQSMTIWLTAIVGSAACFIMGFIPVVGGIIGGLISAAVGIFCFVCMILGIVNASNEEKKELPVIGAFRLYK
ncbi:MAG: DUF4870 domain-containing protein [Lachnoclostridium sp.]|nr:DUF4870 domain-containing protein [Lachnospira sp.]MCM1248716.1 DUF4870 domain-containing protein [Lachnoclostridium sp.]